MKNKATATQRSSNAEIANDNEATGSVTDLDLESSLEPGGRTLDSDDGGGGTPPNGPLVPDSGRRRWHPTNGPGRAEPPPALRSFVTAPGALAVRGIGTGEEPPPPSTPLPRTGRSSTSTNNVGEVAYIVIAEVVNEREQEDALRRAILSSAVQAQEVRPADVAVAVGEELDGENDAASTQKSASAAEAARLKQRRRRRWCWAVGGVLTLGAVLVAIVFAVVLSTSNRSIIASPAAPEPTVTYGTYAPSPQPSNANRDVVASLGDPIRFNRTTVLPSTVAPSTATSALSLNGTVLAVVDDKFVHVWDYVERQSRWERRLPPIVHGNPLTSGDDDDDSSGSHLLPPVVALSADGWYVAVGAPSFRNKTGLVQVWEPNPDYNPSSQSSSSYNATPAWIVRGSPLTGNATRLDGGADGFGNDVALSSDGSILVVAASNPDNAMLEEGDRGYVEVWSWDKGLKNWQRVDLLIGLSSSPHLAVAVSGNGRVVAMGDTFDGTTPGSVALWDCDPTSGCTSLGPAIVGTDYEDMAGSDVSLSEDGFVVAIGAPGSYECQGRPYCGNIRVFEYYGTEPVWVQRGQMIIGDLFFGSRLQLSYDGFFVAAHGVLPISNDDSDVPATITQLYRLDDKRSWQAVLETPLNGTFMGLSYDASTLAIRSETDDTIQAYRCHWLGGLEVGTETNNPEN